ncbi:nuclear transport factor 2 family protein [Pseudonocardia sp. GCM10023141]|uniref:nuclear transport factor 2 family protein n=1 Tax=Pseudonocardia sp. GCM10023141 TaxID=3252653 RepID=UPI0036089102
MTTSTVTAAAAVAAYIRPWNITDAAERAAAVDAAVTPDVRFVDPLSDLTGSAALSAAIGGVQSQFAGMELRLHGDVDAHHDVARFQWALGPAGAEPLVIGFDTVTFAADGRIATVSGFFDQVPG